MAAVVFRQVIERQIDVVRAFKSRILYLGCRNIFIGGKQTARRSSSACCWIYGVRSIFNCEPTEETGAQKRRNIAISQTGRYVSMGKIQGNYSILGLAHGISRPGKRMIEFCIRLLVPQFGGKLVRSEIRPLYGRHLISIRRRLGWPSRRVEALLGFPTTSMACIGSGFIQCTLQVPG